MNNEDLDFWFRTNQANWIDLLPDGKLSISARDIGCYSEDIDPKDLEVTGCTDCEMEITKVVKNTKWYHRFIPKSMRKVTYDITVSETN